MKTTTPKKRSKAAIWMALATVPALANAAAETQDAVLPEVSVTQSKEATEKFRADKTSTATKTETALRDVPQSVSVVTKEIIESQRAFNLRDALKNVSGLSIAAGEGGRTGDSITLRGNAASSDMYLDGVKDNGQYTRDTFFIERAEVLKGSSSVLFGRGSTGGVINQVSKQADGKTRLEANMSGGTDDFKRITVDAGTALTDVVAVRLNALWHDAESFRDENFVERKGLAPSVKFTFSPKASLTLNYLYQKEDSVFDYGLPMFRGKPANVSTSSFYGFKDDLLQQYDTNVASAILAVQFSDDFSVKNTLRYGDYYRTYRTLLISGINQAAQTATYSQALRDSHQQNIYNQTDFTLKTPVFGMPNTLVFGAEFGREDYDFRSKNSAPANQVVSIFNPVFATSLGAGRANDFSGTLATNRQMQTTTKAAYVLDQLELTKQWKLLAGTRYDDFKADQTDLVTPANDVFDSHNHTWSPRAGVVWQPSDTQSYYFSYGESFNPTAEQFGNLTSTSSRLDPEENKNIEIGAKWDIFGGRATLTSAIYRLEKNNARMTDPNNAANTILGGETRTDGFELELAGEVVSNLNVSAAYAHMDAEVIKSTTTATGTVSGLVKSIQGMTVANVPENSGTVWATYRILHDWEVGGGLFFSGSRFTDTVEEAKLPGYARLDAVLAYHQPKYDVQLNLYNLLDKRYFESGQNRSALPGLPLSGMLTLSLHY